MGPVLQIPSVVEEVFLTVHPWSIGWYVLVVVSTMVAATRLEWVRRRWLLSIELLLCCHLSIAARYVSSNILLVVSGTPFVSLHQRLCLVLFDLPAFVVLMVAPCLFVAITGAWHRCDRGFLGGRASGVTSPQTGAAWVWPGVVAGVTLLSGSVLVAFASEVVRANLATVQSTQVLPQQISEAFANVACLADVVTVVIALLCVLGIASGRRAAS